MFRISIENKKVWIFFSLLAIFVLVILFILFGKRNIEVKNGDGGVFSRFESSLKCENQTSRPLAVMLSSDPEARPLSAIGQADIVFEMPVTDSGVTRMMAVFHCEHPKEIGSIRSARLDFVPFVQGLDAIYSHWGGEHTVLEQLNRGIVDNVDGLKYDGTVYYRKSYIPAPHNGFTSYQSISDKADALGYVTTSENKIFSYEKGKSQGEISPTTIYSGNFAVSWLYDKETNSYLRTRANTKEIDANTKTQVSVSNVVILNTTWSPISKDYIRVNTVGKGEAIIYKNGISEFITWKKTSATSPLVFLDKDGKEINFVEGKIWIEVVI